MLLVPLQNIEYVNGGPGGDHNNFAIIDNDISPTKFVHIISVDDPHINAICDSNLVTHSGQMQFTCDSTPSDGDPLRYIIIDVPSQVVTSSLSVSESTSSSPFDNLKTSK